MSYDKGKTIKEYMQGGYAQPMEYQTGGYIPGVSSALYRTGLDRRTAIAQDEQREQGKALEKQGKRRGLFTSLGKLGGTIAGGALATALAPVTGGASLLAGAALAKGLGSAGGSFLGEKLAGATASDEFRRVGQESSTGLLDTGFEELGDIRKEYGEGALGRSLATGLRTGLSAGGADYLMNLGKGKDVLEAAEGVGGQVQGLNLDTIAGGETGGLGLNVIPTEQVGRFSEQGQRFFGNVPSPASEALSSVDDASSGLYNVAGIGSSSTGYAQPIEALFNQGGKVYGYENGGEAINFKKEYFDRDFPKDSFKAMIKEAVDRGEIDPREGLQHILNKQQKDFMKSQDDTSNVLYKQLEKSGYAGGGLINMLPFNRRIM